MKKIHRYFLILLIAGIVGVFNACDCVEGEGRIVTEKRDVSGFTKIELRIGANVTLTQDSFYSFSISAQENLIEIVKSQVSGKTLKIRTEENCVKNTKDIDIRITLPVVEKIRVTGSGDIFSKNTFTVDDLDLDIIGSGDIILDVVANRISTDISGSGSVKLSGTVKDQEIDITGSGDVYAYRLTSYDTEIDITGSDGCEVYVHNDLDVKISGSGDVSYKGSPQKVNSKVHGSGGLHKRN